LNDPNKVLELAGDNVGWLSSSVNLLAAYDVNDNTLVERALDRIKTTLEHRSRSTDATAGVFASLARIYQKDNDPNAAIEYYGKALVRDYGQVSWRYAMACLLEDQGKWEEALHEAKICLRLDSNFTAARRLIEHLSVKVPGGPDPVKE
jgi:tetratricopeptide (TPR) repeat protein